MYKYGTMKCTTNVNNKLYKGVTYEKKTNK